MSAEVDSPAAGRNVGVAAARRAAPIQQRLWLMAQMHPDSWTYNITSSIELTGALDAEALQRASADLYARHDALRMTFRQDGSDLRCSVGEPGGLRFDVVDLADEPDPRRVAERRVGAASETPMDLVAGPVFKLLLCRLGPRSHMLTIFVHHIVADAWSVGMLWEELGLLYARHRGEDVTLGPVGVSYVDYAEEEWRRTETPEAGEELGRWLERLEGVDTDNSLRTDRPRPPLPSFRGATVELEIPTGLARGLGEKGRELRSTPFIVLLAGFVATLALYDRKRDVVVATQVAGRRDDRLSRTVGFFVNTLPLRFALGEASTLEDLVKQAREVSLEAFVAEHVTFEQLLQEVGSLGDRSMNPLAQVAFQLLNVPIPDVRFADLESRRWWDTGRGAKFDLSVMLVPKSEGGFLGLLTYATDLFEEATIRELWRGYLQALEEVVADPARRVGELSLLSGDQRRSAEEWSRGPRPTSEGEALLARLSRNAGEHADRVALRSGGAGVTYAELWSRAGRLAARLQAAGVRRNDVVLVNCASRPEAITAIVAVWRAGATSMVLEPAFASSRLLELVGELKVSVGVRSPGAEAEVDDIEWVSSAAPDAGPEEPDGAGAPEHAYVVTTSGTTGLPRAIAAGMGTFGDFVTREAAKLTPDRVVLQVPPLSFDPGMRDVFTTLAAGAELILPEEIDANPVDAIADVLGAGRADSILAIVPSVLDGVVNEVAAREIDVRLRELRCCGEALPRAVARRAARTLGCIPANDYGSSECTMVSASARQDPAERDSAIMPIGRPLPGVEVWVLGPEGQLLPPGFTGEIHIAGDHLAAGYLGDPEATARRFVRHPFGSADERIHRTGDLGYFDSSGLLHIVGRVDRQVKVRGVRVEIGEIETALLSHPAVADVAVVPVGEDVGRRLVAYVVADDDCTAEDLRRYLTGELPRAAVPSGFQRLPSIPRTGRGKLEVDLLPAPAPVAEGERVPLAGELEEKIADVWRQVLGEDRLPGEGLAANDDFFDLGGDSLGALQMAWRVSRLAGCRLSIADVFDQPTIGDLAAHVERSAAA